MCAPRVEILKPDIIDWANVLNSPDALMNIQKVQFETVRLKAEITVPAYMWANIANIKDREAVFRITMGEYVRELNIRLADAIAELWKTESAKLT